jgi:hypothetical protein
VGELVVVRLRKPNASKWFDAVEEAELRRLVFYAFAARGTAEFGDALRAIEDWQWQTSPERLERHAIINNTAAAEKERRQ